jgi:Helix-turn-helix.
MDILDNFVTDLHIGSIIEDRIEKLGISKAEFSRKLQMPQSNASRFLKKKSINTTKLQAISMKLNYNFFEEFCGREDQNAGTANREWPIVNIGSAIESYLKEIKMTQIEFAELLGVKQPEISRLLKRSDIETERLAFISKVLKHNFFEEFCTPTRGASTPSVADLIRDSERKMTPINTTYQIEFTAEEYQKFLLQQLALPEEERIVKITAVPKNNSK